VQRAVTATAAKPSFGAESIEVRNGSYADHRGGDQAAK
jgi:hypothetical protein